jgi:hypothetical protein
MLPAQRWVSQVIDNNGQVWIRAGRVYYRWQLAGTYDRVEDELRCREIPQPTQDL